MFTGIIQAVGQLSEKKPLHGDYRMKFLSSGLNMDEVDLGDSIAVNGVCLTVVEKSNHSFSADVSRETVSRTSLANLQIGADVNLEMALTPSSRLGGHLVSGHVDGVGVVKHRQQDARSEIFVIQAPQALMKYIAEKGSICVDGVSLTVNKVEENNFTLNIVPHTLQHTTMQQFKIGTQVNLEVDVVARYVERLLVCGGQNDAAGNGLTLDKLQAYGFGQKM